MSESPAGLYLHLPFCRRVCPYCDFAVRTGDADRRHRFVDTLLQELALHRESDWHFDTIYFGGGTPSLIDDRDLTRIVECASDLFSFADDRRIFLEANPEDVTADRVAAWRALGIATLSIGVQSFDDTVSSSSAGATASRVRWRRSSTPGRRGSRPCRSI